MNATFAEALQSRLPADAVAFLPELVLCGAIVVMLLIRLVPRYDHIHMGVIAILIAGFACGLACYQWTQMTNMPRTEYLFGGMLVFDNFTIFLKIFLLAFLTLVILLTLLTGIPDREDSADFYVLLFGSTLGMALMASSSHLLMVFLSIEMASLPSYALAGFLKGRRQSSEAALKYVVYGGGASGVMLYGISLLAGKFGTGFLPVILVKITAEGYLMEPAIIMGVTFVLAGIGFKLASVPFHFWCPDVFEGAAAEVGAFLSVASKGAALAMLARVVLGMGGLTGTADRFDAWNVATDYLVPVLAVFAVATTTFGNLAAYGQTNLKRLLAYSTIAHAGFMMMGLAALNRDGAAAVLFYLVTYLFMNLGAFAVVAMLRNLTGQEDISYFRGFIYRSPILVITLGVFLLSLLGMPPLAGFMAKFQIFTVLYDAGQEYDRLGKPHLSWTMYMLLLAGGLNTVISLFYYVKVLKVMILEKTLEDVEERPVEAKPAPILHSAYVVVVALVVLGLGVYVNPLADASGRQGGIADFRSTPRPTVTKGTPKNAPIGLKPGMKMDGN